MTVCGICVFLIAPILTGALILGIFREKTLGYLKMYALGFLSLFVLLLGVLLVALKLDFDLYTLEKVYFALITFLSLLGIPFLFINKRKLIKPEMNKRFLLVIIPATALGLYSYFYLAPSILGNDTWEVVSTTMAHGTLYEYSSMTGRLMKAGVPIWNKILVLPMFIACMCDFFNIPVRLFLGFLLPVTVYVLNLSLVWIIGREIHIKKMEYYMLLYMLLLMCGTDLAANGIPSTAGFVILREGYTGYSVAYGVALPLISYLLLKKKYLLLMLPAASLLGCLRLDRIFFAIKTPFSSFSDMNEGGKIFGVFVATVIINVFLSFYKKEKCDWRLVFCPEAFISATLEGLLKVFEKRKERIAFNIGACLIILSVCDFSPFENSNTLIETLSYENYVQECIDNGELSGTYIDYADIEFMSTARRLDGSIETSEGRDSIDDYLIGINFEEE